MCLGAQGKVFLTLGGKLGEEPGGGLGGGNVSVLQGVGNVSVMETE